MQVTAAIHARVVAKLKAGIALAEAKYGRKFEMPRVIYEKRGTTAGTASYVKWEIDLNAGLLMRNVEDFIERTVPHELAHLITDRVYPENHHNRGFQITRGGRFKRAKRDVHGADWQSVCTVLGMSNITRCHQYDTSETKVVKSNGRQDKWQCGCGEILTLTPKKSAKLDLNPHALWHRGCKGRSLKRVTALPTVDLQKYGAIAHPALPATKVQVHVPSGESKIDACKRLYLKFSMCSRADIIAKFVSEAGCTPAGGATYFATCKKAYG